MKNFRIITYTAAVAVLLICIYVFLLGNEVFEGRFDNDALAWYFLAKGIFCSLLLILTVEIFELLWRWISGKCAKCGYDLRGRSAADTCPECGHQRTFDAH